MKKKVALPIITLMILTYSNCYADGPYLLASIGYGMLEDMELSDNDHYNGVVEGVLTHEEEVSLPCEIGYAFGEFRVGAILGYGSASLDSSSLTYNGVPVEKDKGIYDDILQKDPLTKRSDKITNLYLLAKLAKDFPITDSFTPHIGLGFGYAHISEGFTRTSDTYFAAELEAGGRLRINSIVYLGFGYRYFFVEDPTLIIQVNKQRHELSTNYSKNILYAGAFIDFPWR